MDHRPINLSPSLSRRRFLRATAAGMAGLPAWLHGWRSLMAAAPAKKDEPSGQMTWAIHVTIAPTWFDPAETPGIITLLHVLCMRRIYGSSAETHARQPDVPKPCHQVERERRRPDL